MRRFIVNTLFAFSCLVPMVEANASTILGVDKMSSIAVRENPKWRDMLIRATPINTINESNCQGKICDWIKLLYVLNDFSKYEQLEQINKFFNNIPYKSDHGQDTWSTPTEFLSEGGDCEDYAIAKYLSLKHLGWDDEDLNIVAVKDARTDGGHAILVSSINNVEYILDNNMDHVSTKLPTDYTPIYAVNESGGWVLSSASKLFGHISKK